MILAKSLFEQPWFILVALIVFFGIIAIVVLIVRKSLKLNVGEKPSEEKIAEENLDRILEDVKDPETQKQFEEYSKNNKDAE